MVSSQSQCRRQSSLSSLDSSPRGLACTFPPALQGAGPVRGRAVRCGASCRSHQGAELSNYAAENKPKWVRAEGRCGSMLSFRKNPPSDKPSQHSAFPPAALQQRTPPSICARRADSCVLLGEPFLPCPHATSLSDYRSPCS